MPSGKVEVRFTKSSGKYTFRFYGIAPNDRTTILLALKRVRSALGTEYDSVALEEICMSILVDANATKKNS
jgi:hypothetical protein